MALVNKSGGLDSTIMDVHNNQRMMESGLESQAVSTAQARENMEMKKAEFEEWKKDQPMRTQSKIEKLEAQKKANEAKGIELEVAHATKDEVIRSKELDLEKEEFEVANQEQQTEIDNKYKKAQTTLMNRKSMQTAAKNDNKGGNQQGGRQFSKQGLMLDRMTLDPLIDKIPASETQIRSIDTIIDAVSGDEVLDGRGSGLVREVAAIADFLGVSTQGYDLESNEAADMRSRQLVFDMIMSNPRGITDEDRKFGEKTYGDLRKNKPAYIHNLKVVRASAYTETMYARHMATRSHPDALNRVTVGEAGAEFNELMGPTSTFAVTGKNPQTGTVEYFDNYIKKAKRAYPEATERELIEEWNSYYSIRSGYKGK